MSTSEITTDPFAAAERLAPIPGHRNAPISDWLRHYTAVGVAAYAVFHRELRGLRSLPAEGSRPELGYLCQIGNAALAAAVALNHSDGRAAVEELWDLTPEQGALNGEFEEWLIEQLDAHGINPADIDPRYTAGDFRSPSVAALVQCPNCTSPYRHHHFVMPTATGTEPCSHGWHDQGVTAPQPSPTEPVTPGHPANCSCGECGYRRSAVDRG